jgi:catechol 2,3-dioxygenase-like lactoylglutathione lyase family enzyme
MTIHGFDHVAVYTVDIDESVRFYSTVMGFEELRRVPNGDNTLVYMKVNETSAIELFDYQMPIGYHEHPDCASGVGHICLSVTGIDAWNEHLNAHGVTFTLPLCALKHLGKRVLLFKDPNGVVIELCEDMAQS